MIDKIAKKILKMEKDKLMSEPESNRDWELITALELAIEALETLEGVTLTRNIDAMEDDAKQASIPYSYQVPKDYIKNKLDYSRPQGGRK